MNVAFNEALCIPAKVLSTDYINIDNANDKAVMFVLLSLLWLRGR